jgi:small conductance mechanosensitive channel
MPSLHLQDLSVLAAKLIGKLREWLETFVIMLPNLVLAFAIVGAGFAVSRWVQAIVERVLLRLTGNEPISRLLASVTRIFVLVVSWLWALGLLHLDKTVTSVLAGVGVVGLALGFAFQDIAANFMSGFIMALHRPFKVGDFVEVGGRQCIVNRIELRATEMSTLDGLSVLVPNKEVLQHAILNYTRTPGRRLDFHMRVAYCDDMEKVRSVVLEAVQNIPHRDTERELELFFTDFADSSIEFELRVWLLQSTQVVFLTARSEAMIAIKKAFDRERITIPFPIRTLDFGAGVAGGERLDQMKLKVVSQSQ